MTARKSGSNQKSPDKNTSANTTPGKRSSPENYLMKLGINIYDEDRRSYNPSHESN